MNQNYTYFCQISKKIQFLVCRRILVISICAPDMEKVEDLWFKGILPFAHCIQHGGETSFDQLSSNQTKCRILIVLCHLCNLVAFFDRTNSSFLFLVMAVQH